MAVCIEYKIPLWSTDIEQMTLFEMIVEMVGVETRRGMVGRLGRRGCPLNADPVEVLRTAARLDVWTYGK